MKGPAFIDSNIWLYAFLKQDEEKRETAKKLIKSIKSNSLYVSTQIINEVSFNLTKNKFPESEIKEILSSFYNDFRVVCFSEKIMLKASGLREKYFVSFWDSLVISAAIEAKCTALYSEDMQHNQVIEKKLKIINPFK
jgi:predicted nucleic acid-binding protein